MEPDWLEQSLPYLVPFYTIALWIGIVWSVGRISGWTRLAQMYPFKDSPAIQWRNWEYGRFGWTGYKGCLRVGVSSEGLSLALWPVFFSLGHPPITIPWRAIRKAEKIRYYFQEQIKLDIEGFDKLVAIRASALKGAESWLKLSA